MTYVAGVVPAPFDALADDVELMGEDRPYIWDLPEVDDDADDPCE